MTIQLPWWRKPGGQMNRTRAAAELVLRCLTARALFRQTPWEMPPNLEYLIVRLLPGGVLINEVPLARTPAIIDDRKDDVLVRNHRWRTGGNRNDTRRTGASSPV